MNNGYTTFVQWKGTDLCMDLNCPKCGKHSHFDGFFMYYIKCPHCFACYEMSTQVAITECEDNERAKLGESDGM